MPGEDPLSAAPRVPGHFRPGNLGDNEKPTTVSPAVRGFSRSLPGTILPIQKWSSISPPCLAGGVSPT
jgi:hypothetical protein